MRKPDCILVRLGEIALKSEQVQKRWMRTQLNNIRAALKASKIEFRTERTRNRIFIYTKNIKKAIKALQRVFGITSVSPAWTTNADIRSIKELSVDLARGLKLGRGKSFAIRSRRAGRHAFTSQEIAVKVGSAIALATKARVDLTSPDKEVFIECREKRAYVFSERFEGPGGLPLGTAGKVLAVVHDKNDLIAAWLMARRGCQLILTGDPGKHASTLKKWHSGRKLRSLAWNAAEKEDFLGVVIGEASYKKYEKGINALESLVLRPLIGLNKGEIAAFSLKIAGKNS